MASANEIKDYIKSCFSIYGLNLAEYFYWDFEDTNFEEIPWINEDGDLLPGLLPFACEILGFSEEEIAGCNEKAMFKWQHKYPYFQHLTPFSVAYKRTYFQGEEFDALRTLGLLFEVNMDKYYPSRFDSKDITKRLIQQLKDLDTSFPGTYHKGAHITDLTISTRNFCQYPDISEMTNSFITMVDNAISLFLKAVKEGLGTEEIKEYNFLVSVLGIRDRFYTRGYLYYDGLIKARELYSSLDEESFRDIIIFKKGLKFKPWQASEFVNDKDLVSRYLIAMPEAKAEMREFAVGVSQFECFFTWSDASPIQFSPEEEEELDAVDELLGEEPIPLEERAKEHTTVYVPKNKEELSGDEITAKTLIDYCRPVKLGGLMCKKPRSYGLFDMTRMDHIQFLLGKIKSNSFMDRIIGDYEFGGMYNA